MKSYVRNTINLSCAKILLTSVIACFPCGVDISLPDGDCLFANDLHPEESLLLSVKSDFHSYFSPPSSVSQ